MAEQEIRYYNLTSLDTKPKDVLNPKKFVSDVIGHKDNDYVHYSKHNTKDKNYYPIINSTDIYWNGFELTYTNEFGDQIKKNIKTTQDLMSILSSMMSYTNILKEKYKNQNNTFSYTISVYTRKEKTIDDSNEKSEFIDFVNEKYIINLYTLENYQNSEISLQSDSIIDLQSDSLIDPQSSDSTESPSKPPTDPPEPEPSSSPIVSPFIGNKKIMNETEIDLYKLFYQKPIIEIEDDENLPTYGDLIFDYIYQLYKNDEYNLLTYPRYSLYSTGGHNWYQKDSKYFKQFFTYYSIPYDELDTYITYEYNGKLYTEDLNKNQLNTYINPEYINLKIYLPLEIQKQPTKNNDGNSENFIGSDILKLKANINDDNNNLHLPCIIGNDDNTCFRLNDSGEIENTPINLYETTVVNGEKINPVVYEFKHLYLYNDISSKANKQLSNYAQYKAYIRTHTDMIIK